MWSIITNELKKDVIQKILLVAIICLLISFLVNQCNSNKNLEWLAQQNQKALTDSLKVVKDNLGN